MRKKIQSTLLLLFLFVGSAFAQPTWTVTPGDYSYNMTVTGAVNLNYIESMDAGDMVAAFINGECRGVQNLIYDVGTDRYIAFLMIYSNNVSGTISFKVYDASADTEIEIPTTGEFSVNGIIGSTEAPYIWSNPTLSNQAKILTFTIPGQEGGTTYNGNDISVVMPFGTDVSALVADYTTSPYARVLVAGITQESGLTANNFATNLRYDVRAADETAEQNYTVGVTFANAVPTDIYLSGTDILETKTLGSTIATLSGEDGNLDDTHSFSFIAGLGDTDNGSFNISGTQLQLNTELDYENKTSYTIRIQIDDNNGGLFEKQFTLNVLDANDEEPQVTSDEITLPESEPLQAVFTIAATDADITPAFKSLTYSISGGNEEAKFSIHPTDGVVSLISALDFETTNLYELEIKVSDGINNGIGILTINVSDDNDETPQVTNGTTQILETKLIGEQVAQIQATDADANSTLRFSITDGNTGSAFTINSTTGIITLASALDFETTQSYTLEISVFDGVNTGIGTYTINIVDVNDEVPQVQDDNVNVPETANVSTAIHTVIATDADANTTLEYSIVSGNTDNHFGINTDTGVLRILESLDYENHTTYYLTIAVFDGKNSSTGVITISIIDENDETPVVEDETVWVSETEPVGFSVTDIVATDADANTTFTYYITSGNTAGKFAVNMNTGEITLADALNYEDESSYKLDIRVNDGINNGTSEITINVQAENDEAPEVTNAIVNLDESAIFGQIVHKMIATDPDGGSVLTYEITAGNTESAFEIEPDHGIVTVLGSLDYETTPTYELQITVDDGLHQTIGTLTINLLNKNDETPIVTNAEVSIDETMAVGLQVLTVSAVDPDGTFPLNYTIIDGNAGNAFELEYSTGIISVASALDFETITSYQLTIGAGDGVEIGHGTMTININDINDETPTISNGTVYIAETLAVSEQVFAVEANDADSGTTLAFSITGGNAEGKFQINQASGIITLAQVLDFETTTSYTLQVTVNDGAESATANISINIIDKNDEMPIMQDATVYVAENETLGYLIHTMKVTDADAGSNFTFEITDGNNDALFSINEYLGVLVLAGSVDYETLNAYTLEIMVSDGVHTSTANVYINITDVDDNIPVVEDAEVTVDETENIGAIVHKVIATDADAVSALTYSIFSGNTGNVFLINPSSGAITLIGDLDFETLKDYVLQVNVSDGTNTASGVIVIHVEDMNDEVPVFADMTLSVNEFADLGTVIGQLTATDADADSELSFTIAAESDNGIFGLTSYGEFTLTDYIDFETQRSYSLTIEVYDGNNTGYGILTVTIEDADESMFNAVNVFSPNGDGINDYWELENNYVFRDCDFLIFNQIGEIVYQNKGYNNDWDGTYNGKELPIGTYYFVVKCADCPDCKHAGSISIIR